MKQVIFLILFLSGPAVLYLLCLIYHPAPRLSFNLWYRIYVLPAVPVILESTSVFSVCTPAAADAPPGGLSADSALPWPLPALIFVREVLAPLNVFGHVAENVLSGDPEAVHALRPAASLFF